MFNRNKEVKEKKPFYKRWWFIALVVIIIVGSFGGDDEEIPEVADEPESEQVENVDASGAIGEEVKEEPEVESEPEEEPVDETDDFDSVFERHANDVFGEQLREIDYNPDDGKILITTEVAGNFNEKMMKRAFHMNVKKYAELIKDEEFIDMYIDGEASMQDQYGNVKDSKVLTVGLTKETIHKINFDNFNIDNIESIADAVFIHPAFQD